VLLAASRRVGSGSGASHNAVERRLLVHRRIAPCGIPGCPILSERDPSPTDDGFDVLQPFARCRPSRGCNPNPGRGASSFLRVIEDAGGEHCWQVGFSDPAGSESGPRSPVGAAASLLTQAPALWVPDSRPLARPGTILGESAPSPAAGRASISAIMTSAICSGET
jgi:hypothetical protein